MLGMAPTLQFFFFTVRVTSRGSGPIGSGQRYTNLEDQTPDILNTFRTAPSRNLRFRALADPIRLAPRDCGNSLTQPAGRVITLGTPCLVCLSRRRRRYCVLPSMFRLPLYCMRFETIDGTASPYPRLNTQLLCFFQ